MKYRLYAVIYHQVKFSVNAPLHEVKGTSPSFTIQNMIKDQINVRERTVTTGLHLIAPIAGNVCLLYTSPSPRD